MKITYMPNPLDTIIELDDHEKEAFRLKIKIKELEEMMFGAHFHLTEGKYFDVEKARNELDPEYWCNDEEGKTDHSKLDTRVQMLLEHYLAELRGSHVGDCTCVPCSCSKCHAEEIVGSDTLKPFPGKHELHQISSAFSRWNPETKKHDGPEVPLDVALEKLRTYKPSGTWNGWEAHAERWANEAKRAYEYLLNYQAQHFTTHN